MGDYCKVKSGKPQLQWNAHVHQKCGTPACHHKHIVPAEGQIQNPMEPPMI